MKIIEWVKAKQSSKNILWKTAFLTIDYLKRQIDVFEINKFLEQNLKTRIKFFLNKIQKETLKSTYFGVPAIKSPMDFWVYMEIIYEIKPDFLIEIGNNYGGSTLAFAHMFDNMGRGRVIGVDTNHDKIPQIVRGHPRITLLTGDACSLLPDVKKFITANDTVLIVEDSSHTYENTLNVLRAYNV